ncbi:MULTISPECIES: LysR family transcriptional regulator [Shewanella]|uniref:LysR family transcriptional regulator n=1 Tax=Shewanella fidelis TaxID=173509 RepID=A0AAW8NPU8_9GAMM|nr:MULTISPECIES: LysR family transcriptional regulator [Shewanella]MDR8525193.1 LysR family transcriptional regulator [Shewanella fidelis]MDW4811264.1 LysR family transcriptional regulator [Shewanella fidelis]MDW4814957.1 LysR family transcriptional regulator [Shewanella fidelis]MDW4819047.1 LysR family transcriptional regulator [Shewanella fidelis]MDW4823276.1 LysR family transcriptional regulator [Shewanella fidelis]
MPDLNGMMLFAAVVRAKGFSQAAREIGMPKSTISRKVAQLEEQLGVRLLQRDTRNLSLTQVGALFYQHCSSINDEIEAAKATVENTHNDVSGLLRIAIPVSFSQELIATLCSGFLRLYPNVELDVQFTDSEVGLVGEGYDIAIKYGPLQSSDLVARLLFERQPILVASPGYLKVHGTPATPQDLAEHSGILLGTARSAPIWPLGKGARKTMVNFKRKVRVNSAVMVKQLVMDDFGIAMLSNSVCKNELASGSLVPILQEWPMEAFKVYGVYSSRRQLATNISAFLDFFHKRFTSQESLQSLMM